jgi:small subunit ribosomal protein S16
MVRMRLMRMGKKKQPIYRVVIADSRSPRDGRFIEIIGQYEPLREPSAIAIDEEKALAWLAKGAQPSEQVTALLKRTGIWTKFVADKPRRVTRGTRKPGTKAASKPGAAAPAEAAAAPAEEPASS